MNNAATPRPRQIGTARRPVTQFDYNDDYPFLEPNMSNRIASDPLPFPPPHIDPCVRITTRIYDPFARTEDDRFITVSNSVLVPTRPDAKTRRRMTAANSLGMDWDVAKTSNVSTNVNSGKGVHSNVSSATSSHAVSAPGMTSEGVSSTILTDAATNGNTFGGTVDDSLESSSDSDFFGSDDDDDDVMDQHDDNICVDNSANFDAPNQTASNRFVWRDEVPLLPSAPQQQNQDELAYLLKRTLRDAIYGRVLYAVVLKRRSVSSQHHQHPHAEWEVTNERCAIKELSWAKIRKERGNLAEDPLKEVAAMQYLKRFHQQLADLEENAAAQRGVDQVEDGVTYLTGGSRNTTSSMESFLQAKSQMITTRIMMPFDVLSDDTFLYSIMPFCDGSELFDLLDSRETFSEEECRYWMHHILIGVENLQKAGVCHRDMSLENLITDRQGRCMIIDMGMALRMNYLESNVQAFQSSRNMETVQRRFSNMNMDTNHLTQNGVGVTQTQGLQNDANSASAISVENLRLRQRLQLKRQGVCGKFNYISPEILQNTAPFDGHAVDLWAVGVILFIMLTGFPPWERACRNTDQKFRYFSEGYLVPILREWRLGLSDNALDLLQRMMLLKPKDRLSLDQVRAHPWMRGPIALPGYLSSSP